MSYIRVFAPGWLLQQSLLRGWLPILVTAAAWSAIVFGVAWWRRAPWHWLVVAGASGVAVVAVSWLFDIPQRVGGTFPGSFLAWAALPVFALGAALWQWRRVRWWRRLVALAAVPALAAFGAVQINAHYAYLPRVRDLLGGPLPGQVSARRFDALTRRNIAARHGISTAAAAPRPSTGVLSELDIPAVVSGFPHRAAFVWLPPVYFTNPRPRLPVLMLLPGTPGSTGDWLRGGGALDIANAYAAAHHGDGPIMVFPDGNGSPHGDTECVNGPRGNADTYLSVDVRNFIESRFGASRHGSRWAIAGLSEGGTCALELASLHPDLFQTFADFSGDAAPTLGSVHRTVAALYGGSWRAFRQHDPTQAFRTDAAYGVEGFVAAGSNDHGYLPFAERVARAAEQYREPVRLDVIPGGDHDFRTWSHALRDAFPWIVERLEAPRVLPVRVGARGGAT